MNSTNLPEFDDRFIRVYDPYAQSIFIRNKSTRDGNLSLDETMDLIAILLKNYQTKIYRSTQSNRLIWMPHAFIPLKPGDQFRGSDDAVYQVSSLIENAKTQRWEGHLRLEQDLPDGVTLRFIDDTKYLRFTHEAPYESVDRLEPEGERNLPPMDPTIAWTLIEKEPGSMTGRARGSPRRELKPRIRDYYKDERNPGYTVEIRGQVFDNVVQFDCWGTDTYSSGRLVVWFERFIQLHIPILMGQGVQQVLFRRRLRDVAVTKWRQDIIGRSIQYLIRTEHLEAFMRRDLMYVESSLAVVDAIDESSPRYIAGQLVTGHLTETEYNQLFTNLSGDLLFGRIYLRDGG